MESTKVIIAGVKVTWNSKLPAEEIADMRSRFGDGPFTVERVVGRRVWIKAHPPSEHSGFCCDWFEECQ